MLHVPAAAASEQLWLSSKRWRPARPHNRAAHATDTVFVITLQTIRRPARQTDPGSGLTTTRPKCRRLLVRIDPAVANTDRIRRHVNNFKGKSTVEGWSGPRPASSSALSLAPTRTTMIDTHIQVMKPMIAPSEP
jgi:hypothetical protein